MSDGKRRLTEADLLTGIVELDAYSRHGAPEILTPYLTEPPERTKARIIGMVEPSDLSAGPSDLWARVRALAAHGKPITWPGMLSGATPGARTFAAWAQDHGMAVAYQSIPAAARILAYSQAVAEHRQHQDGSARALEAAAEAFRGVAGG